MKFLKQILSFLFAGFLIWSCDVIEPPFIIDTQTADTIKFPVPEFAVRSEFVKKVLLEEFTGHKCGNCPRAAEELVRLEASYHEQLVPLAIHVTDFFGGADETGYYSNDYRTETGAVLNDYYGIESAGLPRGMVNRTEYNEQIILSFSEWEGALIEQLSKEPLVDVQIITQYDADSNQFAAHVQTQLLANFSSELNLSVFLVEDSIVSAQKDYNHDPTTIEDYVHRHMLRKSLNGTWGDPLIDSEAEIGEKIIKSYSSDLDVDYKLKDCYIVAFVLDANSREILHAEQAKIIE